MGIENPLLDISVTVNDTNASILTKYDLKMGSACLASENQKPLYDEIWHMEGR